MKRMLLIPWWHGIYFKGFTVPFVAVVALNFVVRPTALIYWVAFAPEIFTLVFKSWRSLTRTLVIGWVNRFSYPCWTLFVCTNNTLRILSMRISRCGVIFVNFLVDFHYYGRPVLPWWNFFIFNFIEGKSAEFGVYPLCWYLYSAIPSILGLNIVLAYAVFLIWPSRYVDELRVITVFIVIYRLVKPIY